MKTVQDATSYTNAIAFGGKFMAAGGRDERVRVYSMEDCGCWADGSGHGRHGSTDSGWWHMS